jgi:Uma2 family endonuclease
MSAGNQLPVMTVAEFLDWPTPDGSDRWELVDGVPVAMAPHPIAMAQSLGKSAA